MGHVRYLQAAAAEADRLIVAINDDAVASLKGPGRPIMKAADRAEMVAALRGADYVIVFPEATVTPPPVLLQRTSTARRGYTADTVPERGRCAPTAGASPSSAIRRSTHACAVVAPRGRGGHG